MDSKLIFVLVLIAVSKTQADECSDERIGERVMECLSDLLGMMSNIPSKEEACREMRYTENCMRTLADECLDEEERAQVEQQMQEMTNAIGQSCDAEPEYEDETESCIEDNKDYILACLRENQLKAISHFSRQINPDQNDIKCTVYNWIADCVTDRVEEKCGEAARDEMREELNDPPQEIKDACEAINKSF